jgi:ferritin-like metal-binding protein YciE
VAQTAIDQLVTWLDDAHAMESGLVGILQAQAPHFSEFPEAMVRIQRHITETQEHALRLERCLAQLGRTPSGVKSTLSSLMGTIEGATTTLFRDRLAKDVLADYAAEQFEVACYTALVSVALRLGYTDIANLCEQNLRDDRAMADWLLEQLPDVVAYEVLKV